MNKIRVDNEIRVSSVEDYSRIDEINKFLWADLVFFQFPIYWFQVPGKLKQYLDDVFTFNEFYSFSSKYGEGGLMTDTKYLVSTTWNAPEYAFNDKKEFFDGKNVDDVLFPLYCSFKYCGMVPFDNNQKALSFQDVVKHSDVPKYLKDMDTFINSHF